jgi:phytoene dehydrogenase-like protein
MVRDVDVIVVGGGLAGLSCGIHLQRAGLKTLLLEASDQVGGRVRTDHLDGFKLDRGFQVMLTAYPEARSLLDFEALQLGVFDPGALVRLGGAFHRVSDPRRRPAELPATLRAPVGSLTDKLALARLRSRLRSENGERRGARPEVSTLEALREAGFSDRIIERFFRPFFGGIFLEQNLLTSSCMFEFVFRMFDQGDAALPAGGMGAIPHQLAERLEAGTIRLGMRVAALDSAGVLLENGDRLSAHAVVVATDGPSAARLVPEVPEPASCPVTCVYYAADASPVEEPRLVLNGEGRGPVNNLCVADRVNPSYAPPGASLISATVLGDPASLDGTLDRDVRAQLTDWFGRQVADWRHLRTYRIAHALPAQPVGAFGARDVRVRNGTYVCGDHRQHASIEGTLLSGRRAADAVLEDLGGR